MKTAARYSSEVKESATPATPPPAIDTEAAAASSSTTDDSAEMKTDGDKQTPAAIPVKCPNTVIIFDWDDTLLASTYLAAKGYRLDTDLPPPGMPHGDHEEVDRQLKELQTCVQAVLELALKYGHVYIVTNAETGWVQLSAQKFLPGVVPMLSRVPVMSARSTFEPMHPDAPLKWKFYAFQERIAGVFPSGESKGKKNIVSFGDSHVEREAVRAVTRGLSNTRTKSVKFAERPSLEQLRRQIELVGNCFHYIHTHDGDLDLQLTVTVNAAPASPTGSSSVSSGPMPPGQGSGLPPVEDATAGSDDGEVVPMSGTTMTGPAIPAEC